MAHNVPQLYLVADLINKIMITEDDYKKAQTTIDEYNKQLCLSGVSDMLLQKEAIDFVMWCKNNSEFVYQYECNRHYNEILYAKFKSNYR